ncbi:glycosyltransferase family 31 protein [Metarhizium guizhouense ARSEF 977]|uniref:Glycosyltransferase family 31 protein n=1 Tax=Metarhizium guizhouense (strain ARSEF 977) TaxID=1276136 RepID=A0A0B4HQ02_METGA|nr:glycosyltransferase family 31 protein [Metarhizium guizhouense ARSEF 977]
MLLFKGMPVLQVRLSYLILTAVTVGFLFHATTLHQQGQTFTVDLPDTTPVGDLLPEEEYFERLIDRYVLTNLTKWQAWRVQTSDKPLTIGSITNVHTDFQPHRDAPKVIDVSNPSPTDLHASKGLELATYTDEAHDRLYPSTLMFGVSTTYKRIVEKDRAVLRAWKRWLTKGDGTSNGATLVLMLDNATEEQLDEIDKELEEMGVDVYTTSTAETTSKSRRYYELIRVMKSYGATIAASGQEKHWFAVIEDTVFFPSLSYLQERLSTYDFSKKLYLGIPSEKMVWNRDGGSVTTYGGGAIFLTKDAVSLIPKLPCLRIDAAAKPSFHGQRWDAMLRRCLEKQAGVDMHVIPAFHPPHNSHEGRLESHETGIRPLLLHDYAYPDQLDVGMAHLVTDACGEACFMHQYLFHDNWVITNGVSISHHPEGLGHRHRHKALVKEIFKDTQKTPISDQIVIDEDDVERRSLNLTGRRRDVWGLLDSVKASDGTVWQAYMKRGVRSTKADKEESDGLRELDSVIVLIWEKKQR